MLSAVELLVRVNASDVIMIDVIRDGNKTDFKKTNDFLIAPNSLGSAKLTLLWNSCWLSQQNSSYCLQILKTFFS